MNTPWIKEHNFGRVASTIVGEDLPALIISHQHGTATISLIGGQVLRWQPEGEKPVLWLSKTANYQPGLAIRGGIPICWPWFGGYKTGGNHGFTRQALWTLESVVFTEQAVEVVLAFSGENIHPLWPHKFSLQQKIAIGREFSQQLTMKNCSDQPVAFSGALHSYFSVSSPANIEIPALAAASFDDKLTGEHLPATATVPCIGPVDRIYHANENMQIIDHGWQRIIELAAQHTQQWVLWNPGTAAAKNIADVHTDGEQEFICLEAANTQWQTLDAGEVATMSQHLRVLGM